MKEDKEVRSAALAVRLDRLIAFLDSYFGQVELISPTAEGEATEEEGKEEEEEKKEEEGVLEESEVEKKKEEESMEGEEEEKEEEKIEVEEKVEEERVDVVRAPVIRVRLDAHHADVNIDDLVRPFLPLLTQKLSLSKKCSFVSLLM